MSCSFATSPGAWGVEPPGSPLDPPPSRVLDEIAAAGFGGVELGPLGYLPTQPGQLRRALDERALRLAGGFVMEPFHAAEATAAIVETFHRTCMTVAGAGAGTVVLIEALTPARAATAGRDEDAERLDDRAWSQLTATVAELAAVASERYDLEVVFHPHAGTAIEFSDEVERLLAEADLRHVGLCLDTGHVAYGGIDAVELCRAHGERIRHVHVKDVDADRLAAARATGRSFQQAVADGVFCPLGTGSLDLAAVAAALAETGFDGWVVFEQDRTPGAWADAQAAAAASLNELRRVGFGVVAGPAADAR